MGVPLTLSSVPAVTPYIQYVATANQTVFPYPFPITQDSDLIVVVNGVTLATDSGYTLSGQGQPNGGSVTFTLGQTAGAIVTLYRDISIQRITQISQNSGYSSTTLNAEFNNFYLIAQQLQASIAQCLQIPNTNNPAPTTTLLPTNYAGKYLSFDSNGNPTPAALTTSGTLTQAIIAMLLNPQTPAEAAANVVPTNFSYGELNVLRYGADPTGTNDSAGAFQAAANVAAEIGLAWVEVPNVNATGNGSALYKCASLIQLSSTNNVGIIGTHGMPFVRYTGVAANTDGPTGALFNFTGGNNESFGGVMNLNLDGNFLCAHGIYAPGVLNVNFIVDNVKTRWFNLDGFNGTANSSGGAVLWQLTRYACYPAVPTATSGFSNVACVGRWPINIGLDTNGGAITLRDISSDNGVSGFVNIQSTQSFGGVNIFAEHARLEVNATNLPGFNLNFTTTTVPALWLRGIEVADATAGSNAAMDLVRNLSTVGGIRGPVVIEQMIWNGINNGSSSVANFYKDNASVAFTVPYDAKLLNTKIELNLGNTVGRFPLGTALNTSPLTGHYTLDATNHLLRYQDGSAALQTLKLGSYLVASPATPVAGSVTDTGLIIDNNSAAAGYVYTLPAISAVGIGWTSPLFEVVTTNGSITVTANAADKIGAKSAGSSYVGTNVVGNSFQVVAGRNGWIITTAWPQANWT